MALNSYLDEHTIRTIDQAYEDDLLSGYLELTRQHEFEGERRGRASLRNRKRGSRAARATLAWSKANFATTRPANIRLRCVAWPEASQPLDEAQAIAMGTPSGEREAWVVWGQLEA